jgi:hypothetical protein
MYEPSPNCSELRQGDIVANIYLPRFGINDVSFLHKLSKSGSFEFSKQAIMQTTSQCAAVISQCCEFNEGKRNSFSLAELIGVDEWLSTEPWVSGVNLAEIVPWKRSEWSQYETDKLLEANSIDLDQGSKQHINVYFLKPDGQRFMEPHIIDFTRVFSIRMSEKDRILQNKILQLDKPHRIQLQQKLAYFYARPAEK